LARSEIFGFAEYENNQISISWPEEATLIDAEKEIEYDEAADRAQQERNQKAAACQYQFTHCVDLSRGRLKATDI
jgi:hypothetical protein